MVRFLPLVILLSVVGWGRLLAQSGNCDANVPFFKIDLTGNPQGSYETPLFFRDGSCCGSGGSDKCLEFEIKLDSQAVAIQFEIASGAIPNGSMFYQINCGPLTKVGTPLCLSGPGPHFLTFCKPGNNENTYRITSIVAPKVSPDRVTREGCSAVIGTQGVELTSITWREITSGDNRYSAYLSCTTGCDTTIVTPQAGYPPFVDYVICGTPKAGPCYPTSTFCDTIRVNFAPPLRDSIAPNPAVYCISDPGMTIQGFAKGGRAPFQYTWRDGIGTVVGTSSSFFANKPDMYSLEIRDSLYPGCPSRISVVNVTTQPLPVVNAGPDVTYCPSGQGVNLSGTVTNASGGLWWGGNGSFTPSAMSLNTNYKPSAGEIAAGFVRLYLTSTGNGRCQPVRDSMIITITSPLDVEIDGPALICPGYTTDLNSTVTGGISPYSFIWNTGNTSPALTGVDAGTYILTVTDASNFSCIAKDTLVVAETTPVIVNITSDTLFACSATDYVTATATGSSNIVNYTWSNNDGGPVVQLQPGKYYVTASDTLGCTAVDSVFVTQPSNVLSAAITEPAPVCFGSTGQLVSQGVGGYGSYLYQWETGETTKTINRTAGTYCVTVTDLKGCEAVACGDIQENPLLTVDLNAPLLICTDATTDITTTVTGGKAPYSYRWSNGATTASLSNMPAGTYAVTVTDVNGLSCFARDSITISEITPLIVNIPIDTLYACDSISSLTVTASGGSGNLIYVWSNGDGTPTAQLKPGRHYVNVFDTLGCTASDTVDVVTPPAGFLAATIDSIAPLCYGTTGTITAQGVNGYGGYLYKWATGETTKTLTRPAGTYCVEVTDLKGCKATACRIIQENPLLTVDLNAPPVICTDASTTITTAVAGGKAPYSYSWSNGATTASITNVPAGTYSVIVTDASGYSCIAKDTITISEITPINVNIPIDTVYACDSISSLSVTASGGSGSLIYVWSNGDGTPTAQLKPGRHYVNVFDTLGCTASDTVDVVTPPAGFLAATIDSIAPLCYGTTGTITAQGVNGYGGYLYKWATGEATKTVTRPAGTYCVEVTDLKGCKATACRIIQENPLLTVDLNAPPVICTDASTTITTAVAGGKAPYSYNWSNGATTASVSNVPAGTYSVTVTDASGYSCTATDNITISEITPLSVTVPSDTIYGCDSITTITITAQGGTGQYRFLWSNGDAGPTVQVTPGRYFVNIYDSLNCTASDTVDVVTPPAGFLAATIDSIAPLCYGTTGTITAQGVNGYGGYLYKWATGEATKTVTRPAGTYCVEVTDLKGCKATACRIIQENPLLTVDLNAPPVICTDASTTITTTVAGGKAPYSYSWSNGATTASVSNVPAGKYWVRVSDVTGSACFAADTILINEITPINVNIPIDTVYACDSISSLTVTANGGSGNLIYVWSNGDGTPTAQLKPGRHYVNVFDTLGCTASDTVDVVTPPAGFLAATIDSIAPLCFGTTGTLTAQGVSGYGGYLYKWASGETTKTLTRPAGNYCVEVTDLKGCKATTCGDILENPILTVELIAPSMICTGATTTITTAVAGGKAPYSYNWSNGATTASISNVPAGKYWVRINDVTGTTCVSRDTIIITESPRININIPFDTLYGCDSLSVLTVTATGGHGSLTYKWSNGDGGPRAELTPGLHYVNAYDSIGCTASDTVDVVTPAKFLEVTIDSIPPLCYGKVGTILAQGSGGYGFYYYQWATGETTKSFTGPAGLYCVTATDLKGCKATTCHAITQDSLLQATISGGPYICKGSRTDVTVLPTGGRPQYTYLWNTGSTAKTLTQVPAGTYQVIIKDQNPNGCSATANITIREEVLNNSIGYKDVSCYGFSDGRATAFPSGTFPPFRVQWLPSGATGASVNNLPAGLHKVEITDSLGCIRLDSIRISQPLPVIGNIVDRKNVSCSGSNDGKATVYVTGGTSPYQYAWSPSGGNDATSEPLWAGSYVFTAIDDHGCEFSMPVVITQPEPLQQELIVTDITCFGMDNGSITAEITGGTAPYYFNWTPNVGGTPEVDQLPSGQYNLTVTDAKNCTISASVNVAEPEEMQLASSRIPANCELPNGTASVAVASGGIPPFSYQWGPSAGNQQNDTAYGLLPGEHSVTVKDANGCEKSLKVLIGNLPPAVATISMVIPPSCHNGSNGTAKVSVSGGTPPFTYQWFNKASGQQVPGDGEAVTGLVPGAHYALVTDANGCVSRSNDAVVPNPPSYNVAINRTNVQCYDACNGLATAVAAGGAEPYAYRWNDPSIQTTQTAYSLCPGLYKVYVTDGNGCVDSAVTSITQPPPLYLDSSVVDASCNQNNGEACVLISGGVGPYTVLWPEGQTQQCVKNLFANTYVVKVTDSKLCEVLIPITISNFGSPEVEIREVVHPKCFGDCDAYATVGLKGDSTFFSVQWDANAGSQTSVTAAGLCAGIYTVKFTTEDGCVASTAVQIVQPEELQVEVTTTPPSCHDDCNATAVSSIRGGVGPYTFEWRNDQNTRISSEVALSELCAGNYELIVTDSKGCSKRVKFTIDNPLQLMGTANLQHITCNSMCNGKIEAVPINGVGPYTYVWDEAANNQSTRTASGLCPGTYNCTITDKNGCEIKVSGTIIQPDSLIAYAKTSRDVSCYGECNGFAEVYVVGGTSPYVYGWSNSSSTSPIAQNLCGGFISSTITDANGCVATAEFLIKEPEPLIVNLTTTQIACNNTCTGSIRAAIDGGAYPYLVVWDAPGNPTSNFIDNLCTGTYRVRVTDGNKCVAIESATIQEPLPFNIDFTVVDANCGQETGEICVTPTGGDIPYTYLWSDIRQQTTPCADSLRSGCYTVLVTDAKGCEQQKLVCINDLNGPSVVAESSKDPSCFDKSDGYVEFTIGGGTGQLRTRLLDKDNIAIDSNSVFKNNLRAGCYTLVVTDQEDCKSASTICLKEPQKLTGFITSTTNVTCNSVCTGSASVKANGGTAPYYYNWGSGSAPTSSTNTGLCAGGHVVLISDANNCQFTVETSISEPTPLKVDSARIRDVSCFGECNGRIDVFASGASGPYNYVWEHDPVNSSYVMKLCPGDYTVTITDRMECSTTMSYTVGEPEKMFVNLDSVATRCGSCNGSATALPFGGVAPYSYDWSGAGDTPLEATTSGLCPGSYSMVVTDKNGCKATGTATIGNSYSPVVDSIVIINPSCFNYTNGSATVHASSGTPPYMYQWDENAKQQTTQTAYSLTNGSYCITVSDSMGCTTTDCITISNPTEIIVVGSPSRDICRGEKAQVYAGATGGSPGYTVFWNDSTLKGFGPHNVSPTLNATYCFFVTDKNGCRSKDTCTQISIIPDPKLRITPPEEACSGEVIAVLAQAYGGLNTSYNWEWEDGKGQTVGSINTYDQSTANINQDSSGYFYVRVTDGCNRPALDSVYVKINPKPNIDIGDVMRRGCAPYQTEVNFVSASGNFYEIDFDCNGNAEYYGPDSTVHFTYRDPGIYSVCVKATSAKGCVATDQFQNLITVYPSPIAEFVMTPEAIQMLEPTVEITDQSSGADYMEWYFGEGEIIGGSPDSVLGTAEPLRGMMTRLRYSFQEEGDKQVTLTVRNKFGCTDVYSRLLTVEPQFEFFAPNAFSPDGDGFNDDFYPKGVGFKPEDYLIRIFDRWGELIFESHDYNIRWDGRIKGVVQDDVYVWQVEIVDFTGHKRHFTGHVTIYK